MEQRTKINLADVFLSLGSLYRDRPALIAGKRQLTFAELTENASQTAHEMRARGVKEGERVGLMTRDGMEMIVSIIGTWMLDATSVPLDFRTGPSEILKLMEDFDIATLVSDRPVQQVSAAGRNNLPLDASFREARQRQPVLPPAIDGPAAPAIIGLTSGTTGRPLGVMMDHAAYLSVGSIQQFQELARLSGTSLEAPRKAISVLPLSFGAARNQVLARLMDGITVELFPPIFEAAELVEAIRRSGAEFLFAVPTVARALLDIAPESGPPLLEQLKLFQVAGAALSPDEKVEMQRRICPGFLFEYASQLSGAMSALFGPDVPARPETVGRVFANARVEIVDEEDRPVAPGVVGQIRARSPRMARSLYDGRDRADGDRILGGWVYPGDLGSLDEQGFLTLAGRSADVIIRGGANVHPAEIEEFLLKLEGVREVAAVGFASQREGEEIAVFVVRKDESLSEGDVLGFCRTGLAPDKRPRKVIFLDDLPRNANGKVLRRELAEQAAQ